MAKSQSYPSSGGRCNTPGKEMKTPSAPEKARTSAPTEQLPPTEAAPIRQHIRLAGGG